MNTGNFKDMKQEIRLQRLRNIITAKARGISPEHVAQIIEHIQLNKQYRIIGIASPEKFIHNLYKESGEGDGYSYTVDITPIYGNIEIGYIDEAGVQSDPEYDEAPAAILKKTDIVSNEQKMTTYEIVIYQESRERISRS